MSINMKKMFNQKVDKNQAPSFPNYLTQEEQQKIITATPPYWKLFAEV